MLSSGRVREVWSLLTLCRTRSALLAPRYRALVGLVGLGYAVATMTVGGMLYFPPEPLRTGWFFLLYPSGPGPSWTYPAILAGGPMFQLDLPLVMGVLLTLTAAGIGLGMSLGVYLGVRLIRREFAGLRGPAAGGAAAGLAPVMFAFATMGACCSTVAAATAGISLAAQSTGSSPTAVLANAWYLGVVQATVVYVALIAQEQLLRIFGGYFAGPSRDRVRTTRTASPQRALGRRASGVALRIALAVAGLTWAVALLAEEFSIPRAQLTGWTVVGGLLQHEVPGLFAVLVAIFPREVLRFWERYGKGLSGVVTRGTLIAAGLVLLTWMPASVAQSGAGALGNELLGFWKFPSGWGAVSPPVHDLGGVLLRWTFQFLLLGAVAIATAISPRRVLGLMIRDSAPSVEPVRVGRFPDESLDTWKRIPASTTHDRPDSSASRL